jgi:hypothetical protein
MNKHRADPAHGAAEQGFRACRAQIETLLQFTDALVMGSERMRGMQLDAARETQALHNRTLDALGKTRDMQGLASVMNDLTASYAQGMMRYWTGLFELGEQAQFDIAGILESRAAHAAGEWGLGTRHGASRDPLVASMRSMYGAAGLMRDAIAKAWKTSQTPAVPVTGEKAV